MRVCFQLIQVFIFLHFFLKKKLFHYSVLESQIYIACFLLGFFLFCCLSEMGGTFMCFLQLYESVSVNLVLLVEVSAFMRNCWVWLGFWFSKRSFCLWRLGILGGFLKWGFLRFPLRNNGCAQMLDKF